MGDLSPRAHEFAPGASLAARVASGAAPGQHPDQRPRATSKGRRELRFFALAVVLPLVAAALYLHLVAAEQFHSEAAFSVRSEDGATLPAGLLGAIAQVNDGAAADADILYDYIRSQAMVEAVDRRLDLRAIWGKAPGDPVFGLAPNSTIEDLVDYWGRMVHVRHDARAGLIDLRVDAFTAQDARTIAEAVLAESARLVNALSDKALADGVRYAEADLAEAESRLRGVREALGAFRQTYRVIDPATDVQGQAGVLGALEAELAEAEIARELLRGFAPDGDHRAVQADRRIAAISARISAARAAEGETAGTEIAPELIGRYEALRTDLGFAEAAYTQALGQLAVARADARRQARYLAAHIAPTMAERALYPRKSLILLTGGVALTLAWAVTAVIVRNIREGR